MRGFYLQQGQSREVHQAEKNPSRCTWRIFHFIRKTVHYHLRSSKSFTYVLFKMNSLQ